MQSNVASDVAELSASTRFLPLSLIFVVAHVLFVGAAIFLAALD